MPSRGATKRHPPSVHAAIRLVCPANSPVAEAPTSQHWPFAGDAGGAVTTASTAGWSNTSVATKASFTVASFWLCPARVAVLGPTQRFGLCCGVKQRLRAARPYDPPQRWLITWPQLRRADGHQPALTFDHHTARFVER